MRKRVALVVGCDQYADPSMTSLDYAEGDATELAGFLRHRAGFEEVVPLVRVDDRRVLQEVIGLSQRLGPGDFFLFFFAGHGVEANGQHLLLFPEVDWTGLQHHRYVVQLAELKERTRVNGVERLFILDACRQDPLKRRGSGSGGVGEGVGGLGFGALRNIVTGATTGPAAPLTVLCACDEGCGAREVPGLKHGLFYAALMGEMEEALREGRELRVDSALQQRLGRRMAELAGAHGMPGGQQPWLQSSHDPPVLLPGRQRSAPDGVEGVVADALVKCPRCGRRKPPGQVFECRICHQDGLCLDHFDLEEECCRACAAKLRAERPTAAMPPPASSGRAEGTSGRQEVTSSRHDDARPRLPDPASALCAGPWMNSLGMRFLSVAGVEVWFGVWPVRVQDYEGFAKATGRVWVKPDFVQGPTHPVANVSWEDAVAFCRWLTAKEQVEGVLSAGEAYRLPRDAEWSWAVGIGDREGRGTPREKEGRVVGVFPWGTGWPPPVGAGNYGPDLQVDDYPHTSPVGVFGPSPSGLFDLGGNVWEWCEDSYDGEGEERVMRGGAWEIYDQRLIEAGYRHSRPPRHRDGTYGFRCVLVRSRGGA